MNGPTNERAEDQRIAESLAAENLWRANRSGVQRCVRGLVELCWCKSCRDERLADAMALSPRACARISPRQLRRAIQWVGLTLMALVMFLAVRG